MRELFVIACLIGLALGVSSAYQSTKESFWDSIVQSEFEAKTAEADKLNLLRENDPLAFIALIQSQ